MNFLENLYEIITQTKTQKTIRFNASHIVFDAHFPNNQILPAFLQIELFEKLFEIKINKIKKAKFIDLIKPDTVVFIEKNENKIIVFNENKSKVSELSYV